MSLNAVPIFYINMGCEMIYILDKRLESQPITSLKKSKVLDDIIRTMIDEKFLKNLFKPNILFANNIWKAIFNKLANSTCMAIASSSMDKLYDLMFMATKYQTCVCKRPEDLITVVLNHLDIIKTLSSTTDDQLNKLHNKAYNLYVKHYSSMSPSKYIMIRQALLEFFQDVHIRVLVFLEANLQHNDGLFKFKEDYILPEGFKIPGKIKYFDNSGRISKCAEFDDDLSMFKQNPMKVSYDYDAMRHIDLGKNMFLSSKTNISTFNQMPAVLEAAVDPYEMDRSDPNAQAQIDLLTKILGMRKDSDNKHQIELNLFSSLDEEEYTPYEMPAMKNSNHSDNVVVIDASKRQKNHSLQNIIADISKLGNTSKYQDVEEDLFELLDE